MRDGYQRFEDGVAAITVARPKDKHPAKSTSTQHTRMTYAHISAPKNEKARQYQCDRVKANIGAVNVSKKAIKAKRLAACHADIIQCEAR